MNDMSNSLAMTVNHNADGSSRESFSHVEKKDLRKSDAQLCPAGWLPKLSSTESSHFDLAHTGTMLQTFFFFFFFYFFFRGYK